MKSFVLLLFVVYELYLCESEGISAGTVFVLKGEDLLLNVNKAVVLGKLDFFSWKCNNSNIVRLNYKGKKVFPNYTGRLEFPGNNQAVILKNLQEADSGVYTAVLDERKNIAEYNVKVQDRASLLLLTVSSVSERSSSCSFTVTCSSQDSHINSMFTCDTRTCSQEGGERSEGIPDTFLQVHQSSGSIICNHSNHVSWTSDTITIKDVCPQQDCANRYIVYIIVACGFINVLAVLFFLKQRTKVAVFEGGSVLPREDPELDVVDANPLSFD